MSSLFSQPDPANEPLAARMRPRTLDEFFGQEQIVGPGRLLRRAIQADMISSVIFYGPPGTGKTTLARVIANTTKGSFVSLNAVLAGVKDVREAIAAARERRELHSRRTILFVDEVHRWNKAQQDALLPWVENGTVILIGATTHNPFFEVNSALVSRSRIFQLKPLEPAEMMAIAHAALGDPERGYGRFHVTIDEDALLHLVAVADGDARGLLGAIQLAVETSVPSFPPPDGTAIRIDRAIAEDSIQKKAVLYDKEGDYHFDIISAFIKSIRGSDPDAALYWMAKMIHGGEDPRYLFRRMLISASEDIGMADPHALVVVQAAVAAFERVGLPEGNFHLAEAALYLATCPKSNSALGYFDALEHVSKEHDEEVPSHLRDESRDKEGFGHGEGYLYPHAYREHWVAQAYLPPALQGRVFYEPTDRGYENTIRKDVLRHRELQLELILNESPAELLTYSRRSDRSLREWARRADAALSANTNALREAIIAAAQIARHDRVLVAGRRATIPLWDSVRAAPEGRVWGVVPDGDRYQMASHYAGRLNELERPLIIAADLGGITSAETASHEIAEGIRFDRLILVDALSTAAARRSLAAVSNDLAAPGAHMVCAQSVPREGSRLAQVLADRTPQLGKKRLTLIEDAEQRLFADRANELVNWGSEELQASITAAGWQLETVEQCIETEMRRIEAKQIEEWMDQTRPGLGRAIAEAGDSATAEALLRALLSEASGCEVEWKRRTVIIAARRPAAET
jgi:putative ATPase